MIERDGVMRRLWAAPGPRVAWIVLVIVVIALVALLRLVIFPDRIVPLAYGLPLLLFIWRRDRELLWWMASALAAILVTKVVLLASSVPSSLGETLFFGALQLGGILVPACVIHILIGQTRALDLAATHLERSHAQLQALNEELVASDVEIGQQNEELQSQAAELEHQTEELESQAEELEAMNEQLVAREHTLDEIVSLSATGASERDVLENLGTMVQRLFEPRAVGAAIFRAHGATSSLYPLFGLTSAPNEPAFERTFASIVLSADNAAFIADLSLRPDVAIPALQSGESVRSVIAAPARLLGQDIVVFEVYSREPGEWTELQLQLIQWCAEQGARLWSTVRLREDLSRLADSERAARSEAERAAREKDEFVATLAHELRTPVGAILGWSSLLRTIAKSPEEVDKGLETIERNARQQARLISDLLDMTRAVSGKLLVDLQPVKLSEVVDASIDVVGPSAAARDIEIVRAGDVAPVVRADAGRLQQVLVNVMTNAIKFTPQHGVVTLTISYDDLRARVAISDTGSGIRPELIPQLFDRYRQADSSSSRAHGGLGLGLSIAKHLVDLHHGAIELLSEGEGRGTTCIISIPLFMPQPIESDGTEDTTTLVVTAADERADDGGGVSVLPNDAVHASRDTADIVDDPVVRRVVDKLPILVVDDDADTLAFVTRLLEEYGAVVYRARSAGDALDQLRSIQPSLIISDIGMPQMDGYELLRRIRQHTNDMIRAAPAIAITAFTRPDDRARALDAGFQIHVSKPIDPTSLMAAIVHLCATASQKASVNTLISGVRPALGA